MLTRNVQKEFRTTAQEFCRQRLMTERPQRNPMTLRTGTGQRVTRSATPRRWMTAPPSWLPATSRLTWRPSPHTATSPSRGSCRASSRSGQGSVLVTLWMKYSFADKTSWSEDNQGGLDGALHWQRQHEKETLLETWLKVHHNVQGEWLKSVHIIFQSWNFLYLNPVLFPVWDRAKLLQGSALKRDIISWKIKRRKWRSCVLLCD